MIWRAIYTKNNNNLTKNQFKSTSFKPTFKPFNFKLLI